MRSINHPGLSIREPKNTITKMKKKNTAALLAIFLGVFGVHKFYLGQVFLGVLYAVFSATGIPFLLSIVDAIVLLTMSEEKFDARYNSLDGNVSRRRHKAHRSKRRRDPRVKERHQVQPERRVSNRELTSRAQKKVKFKKLYAEGLKLFKDYQFGEAEQKYLEALALAPAHPRLLFDLACLYSMKEETAKGFEYLELAVYHGFDKFDEIEHNPSLAYLRILDEFLDFAKAGYKRVHEKQEESLSPEMLEKLKQLDILKSRGLLTELEFEEERKKILL